MEEILHRFYHVDFLTAPYPLCNIGIESLQKQICSNDGNPAPPQTKQLSMLKRGCGDASSRHLKMLIMQVVQDFLHPQYVGEPEISFSNI